MATMIEIEQHTKDFADRRASLAAAVDELNEAIEALKRKHMPVINRRVAGAAEAHAALKELIECSAALFGKPRTVVVHGVRVGFQKGKGKIEYDDGDQVVKLIRKHFDLRPYGIIKMLDLIHPMYQQTAAYGHFGRKPKEFS